jgi:hypothetical protein
LSPEGNACLDVNECLEKAGFCADGFCRNTEGGVLCECPPGWQLTADGSQCNDVREEPCYNEQVILFNLKLPTYSTCYLHEVTANNKISTDTV